MSRSVAPPKAKVFPLAPRHPWLRAVMQSCPVILAINWCFQGTRGMDRGERAFRLALEAALALLLTPFAGWLAALVIAHSFNFLFNGQLWVCARYCPAWRRSPRALDRFLAETAAELRRIPWLEEAVCIGSRAAGSDVPGPNSDIDLRLVRPPGLRRWLAINLLLLRLRTRALFRLVPLDLYAYDDLASLDRFRRDEPLLVILDRAGRIARRYAERPRTSLP
ncbi:MAG: hypothetical protein N2038_12425 [Geminicoccaceae bacterium]|nr:hypothetical protein [Geminicoccaceae bacterium]